MRPLHNLEHQSRYLSKYFYCRYKNIMAFKYRFEKVLAFRIMKQKEQEEAVKKAELEVQRIQTVINKTKNDIVVLGQSKFSASHIMIENYDNYIKHLYNELEKTEKLISQN